MAVKFLWPVGGALMQCFKARDPSGSESKQGGREKEGKRDEGWERMLQQQARMPPKRPPKLILPLSFWLSGQTAHAPALYQYIWILKKSFSLKPNPPFCH